jgi:hypothetical protein
MKKILDLCGMSLGGWVGWVIGAEVSTFTAYMVSTVGSGIGLYYSIKITKALLP